MKKIRTIFLLMALLGAVSLPALFGAEFDRLIIPRLKYGGGGDWYTGPTSMPNLLRQAGERLGLPVRVENIAVSVNDPELFRYPMLYMTGHGQVKFKDHELNTLLNYLNNGGFLFVNDSYGMEKYIKREIRRLYPDIELVQLPKDHAIFNTLYEFPDGLPKIHEHDDKPPTAYALFSEGRMKILYLLESDVGDGLEDAGIHRADTPEIREKAMRMALNILVYAMNQ
jgi:hypothetical protein